jgi:hypothetical protein
LLWVEQGCFLGYRATLDFWNKVMHR